MFTPSRIAFLPVALAAAQPAQAIAYLSIAQAQQLMFPGQTLLAAPLQLNADDIAAVERATGTRYLPGALRAWKTADDGYFFVDAVIGKHDLISYAVALSADGKIRQVEILEYREAYGGEVRNAAWRSQFIGRAHGDSLQLGRDIRNISGATLSCQHVTDGIRRLLAVYAIAIKR